MDYKKVLDVGQYDEGERPAYDGSELQKAVDARTEWVRVRHSRYAEHLEEPTEDFRVTIDGQPWHVVECASADHCNSILLQRGCRYLLHIESLFIGHGLLWATFAANPPGVNGVPPTDVEPFVFAHQQRALARATMFGLWAQ